MEKLSFVIPCYRSENTLSTVVDEIIEVVSKLKEYSYEIVLVNDNSPDNTFETIQKLCAENHNIKGINLSRNFGQHSAMMAGFKYITGDIVIDVDDDAQVPIDELPALLEKINSGYDIVIGEYENNTSTAIRKIGTMVNDYMAQILINKPKDIHFTSFVVMKRFIVEEMLRYKGSYPYLAGLMLRSSAKIANVPVNYRERASGKSGYTFSKLLALWINGFTAFSVKPLRISIAIGIVFAVIGFIIGLYTIINKFINPEVPIGWSSTTALLSVLGGIILIILGMIGEYVGRIYISINNSPQYVIRETINIEAEKINRDIMSVARR